MTKKKELDIEKGLRGYGVIFVCFALICALAPIGVFKILAMQRETLSWPTVEGIVIVCEIDHRVNDYADPGEEDEYRVDLVYEYTVNNETYENDDIYYWSGTESEYDHKLNSYEWSLLRNYPEGSSVTVYYKPENPARSCLIPGENPNDRPMIIWFPITGYIMLACVPLFYFADKFAKNRKKKKKEHKSFTTPELLDKINNASEN